MKKLLIALLFLPFISFGQTVTNQSVNVRYPLNYTPYAIIDLQTGDTLCWYWNRSQTQIAISDSISAHPSGAGTVTSITAGTGISGGTITTSGTISLPNTGTAGTYGSATQIPVFTTDAQGRVTSVTNTTLTTPTLAFKVDSNLTSNDTLINYTPTVEMADYVIQWSMFVTSSMTGAVTVYWTDKTNGPQSIGLKGFRTSSTTVSVSNFGSGLIYPLIFSFNATSASNIIVVATVSAGTINVTAKLKPN